jgi:hypothetical protein
MGLIGLVGFLVVGFIGSKGFIGFLEFIALPLLCPPVTAVTMENDAYLASRREDEFF